MCVPNIHTNTNGNCDSLADSYPDTQRDTNSYSYGYSDDYGYGYCHCNSYSYRYGHCHGETNAYREAPRNAEATSYSAATPLKGAGVTILGSARVSRAGFGVHAETNFAGVSQTDSELSEGEKVRDGEDTIASTRDACATRNASTNEKGRFQNLAR